MRPRNLLLHCFAEISEEGQWQAFCLDFDLAAQGDTLAEAKAKLEGMLVEYVHDALVGEDREFAAQLIGRRAPLSLWVRYFRCFVFEKLGAAKDGIRKLLQEPIPLNPEFPHHA